jgi:hypothetical protein
VLLLAPFQCRKRHSTAHVNTVPMLVFRVKFPPNDQLVILLEISGKLWPLVQLSESWQAVEAFVGQHNDRRWISHQAIQKFDSVIVHDWTFLRGKEQQITHRAGTLYDAEMTEGIQAPIYQIVTLHFVLQAIRSNAAQIIFSAGVKRLTGCICKVRCVWMGTHAH